MADTRNADLLREGHAAFNDRDRDRLLEKLADDVIWHSPGETPLAGTHEGRDQVWERFFGPMWESPMRVEDHEVTSTDEYATAHSELVVPMGDEQARFELFEIGRIEDGRLVERWAFVDRQSDLDQLIRQAEGQLIGAGS